MEMHQEAVHRGRVDTSGRVMLPAAIRARLSIRAGDEVVIREDDDGLHLLTLDQAVRQLQQLFAAHVPPGVSLANDLLEERRAEAARE
jgi:AbrB family looped-hinge helix DNA binding protein